MLSCAIQAWRSLDASPRYRFLVFLLGKDAQDWWKSQALECEGMQVEHFDQEPDTQAIEHTAEVFSDLEIAGGPGTPKAHSIIVLGEERATDPGGAGGRRAVDDLVRYLRDRDPKRIEHWDDGWYMKSLPVEARVRLFGSEPLFVRALLDGEQTKGSVRDRLRGALLSATGFGHLDDTAWNEHFSRLKRIYWSNGRPDWTGKDEFNELWLVGQAEEIGGQLAEMAGLASLAPHSMGHIRYERPDLRDKVKREKAEQLLASKLPEAIRPEGDGGTVDTVPIIEEGIEDSVRKFSPFTLNVLAVHDLETRPGDEDDAIERFSRAEDKIQTAVRAREDGQSIEIVRVAVLFNNFRTFDGVRFSQGSPVYKWNLLKCPSSDAGIELDPIDLVALRREARLQWESITAQRAGR